MVPPAPPRRPARASSRAGARDLIPALVALVVVATVATNAGPTADVSVNDLFVYRTYAGFLGDGLWPYSGFGFEYPPLALVPIALGGVLGTGEPEYGLVFGLGMLAAGLAGLILAAGIAGEAGGSRRGAAWVVALSPIATGALVRTHFDPVAVALALGGLLLVLRSRPVAGAVVLAAGALTKLFPALLALVALAWLAGRDERAAVRRAAAAFAAVAVLVSLPFAGAGYVDFVTFHLERPVQIESTAASVLFALGGSDVTGAPVRPDRFKSNGLDGGAAGVVEALFTVALLGALALVVALTARRPGRRALVLGAFAALLAFVSLGKVLSPQFVVWLVPVAAVGWALRERLLAALVGLAIVLTQAEFPSRYFDLVDRDAGVVALVAARNALLLTALAVCLARLRSQPREGPLDHAGGSSP